MAPRERQNQEEAPAENVQQHATAEGDKSMSQAEGERERAAEKAAEGPTPDDVRGLHGGAGFGPSRISHDPAVVEDVGRRVEPEDTRVMRADGALSQVRDTAQPSGRFSFSPPAVIPNPDLADTSVLLVLANEDTSDEEVEMMLEQVENPAAAETLLAHLRARRGTRKGVVDKVRRKMDRLMRESDKAQDEDRKRE